MKSRKTIVISLVSILIVCAVVASIFLLLSQNNKVPDNTNKPPESYPLSYVIKPDDEDNQKYVYATIEPNQQIKMKTKLGDELIIQLDKRTWKDLRWSPQGNLISVLGETSKDVFNIFIYNLTTKNWTEATKYTDKGVDSYVWTNNDVVLFTQGEGSNRWVHKYTYTTRNEILKLNQIEGKIASTNSNGSLLLVKNPNNVFSLHNNEGKVLFYLNAIRDKDSEQFVVIEKIFFSKSDLKAITLVNPNNEIFTHKIGENTATKLNLVKTENQYKSICVLNTNNLLMYRVHNTTDLVVYTLNTSEGDPKEKFIKYYKNAVSVNTEKSGCVNEDNALVKLSFSESEGWYYLDNDNLERLVILDGAVEVAMKSATVV